MHNLDELIKAWESSVLDKNLQQAETLINLLIVDNERLQKFQKQVYREFPDLDMT